MDECVKMIGWMKMFGDFLLFMNGVGVVTVTLLLFK